MAQISADRDTFLPRIESAFYATFHETKGPQILFQVPEGLISQGGSGGSSSVPSGSKNTHTSQGTPSRGVTESTSGSGVSAASQTSLERPNSFTNLVLTEEPKSEKSSSTHRASNSASSLDTSSSSSPVSYRAAQQNRHLQRSSPSPSPRISSSPQPAPQPAPLLDFSDISRYVIPSHQMCGRLMVFSTKMYRVMGLPVCLESAKYKREHFGYNRVHFQYNLCFVFERTADLSCYEPVVRKIARVLMACEEESSFLSNPHTVPQIYPILEQLYEDLNNYHETSIPIDQFNSIELKLFPFYPNPPDVYDWMVPLALINLVKRMEPNWDLTVVKVCKYIDGINHVSRIANLADCDLGLTRKAISHLLYYQCIMLIDIFQYSNIYTLERSLQHLADDPNIKEECGPYVTRPGYTIQDWAQLLFLYSRLKPGKTVFEWEEEHDVRAQGIDVRRFMSFGVIKGFVRRIHRWPILMPESPPGNRNEQVPADQRIVIGRKRGKSLSHTTKEKLRPAEIQRERSQSQSQAQNHRALTEAEEYARSIQLRDDQISKDTSIRPRSRNNSTSLDVLESRRQSFHERPVHRRQSSGAAAPHPHAVNVPGAIESHRPQFRATHSNSQLLQDSYHSSSASAYPPELPALLDGTHHTDELATRFEAGWPVIEKWFMALGGGSANEDFGRVAIMYR